MLNTDWRLTQTVGEPRQRIRLIIKSQDELRAPGTVSVYLADKVTIKGKWQQINRNREMARTSLKM